MEANGLSALKSLGSHLLKDESHPLTVSLCASPCEGNVELKAFAAKSLHHLSASLHSDLHTPNTHTHAAGAVMSSLWSSQKCLLLCVCYQKSSPLAFQPIFLPTAATPTPTPLLTLSTSMENSLVCSFNRTSL